MKKTLLGVFMLACLVLGQDEGGEASEEGDQPTEEVTGGTEMPSDGFATTLPTFTLETDPDTTLEATTSMPSTTTTTTTTTTSTTTTVTTTTSSTTTTTTTTSSEAPTTLLFEATVDEVEEEDQELEKEEGDVKEVTDETEVSTKTAGIFYSLPAPSSRAQEHRFGWVGSSPFSASASFLLPASSISDRCARQMLRKIITFNLSLEYKVDAG